MAMANDNPNPLFAYAESRIAAWQAVLASLKAAVALDASGQLPEGVDFSNPSQNGDLGQPVDLPDGAFFGKSIPQCIELYLSAAKKKKTVKEIAIALRDGGVETTSDNFESSVTTALNRLKAAGKILKFKDGWGLSIWYPANLRGAAPSPSKRSKGKRGRAKKAKAQPTPAEDNPKAATNVSTKPLNERILDALRSGKKAEYSLMNLSDQIGVGMSGTRMNVGKLVKAGKIEKTPHENYRIPLPKLMSAGD